MLLAELALAATIGFNGRCPVCVEQGLKSTVDGGGSCWSTLIYHSPGHWDEDGRWHDSGPNPNRSFCKYRCSRGHSFQVEQNNGSQIRLMQ